ncbi:MAG: TonB-dependent receptor, partial [Gammaproteobacteria bacterium]
RRAENTASLSAHYKHGIWILNSNFLATSSRKDSDFSSIINPGYGLVNLGLLANVSQDLQVSLKVDNVLDKQYTLAHGFNTADRSVYVGIRYQGGL